MRPDKGASCTGLADFGAGAPRCSCASARFARSFQSYEAEIWHEATWRTPSFDGTPLAVLTPLAPLFPEKTGSFCVVERKFLKK